MARYKHVGLHPEELVGGVMIGPGEEIDLSSEQEGENQWLIDEGVLMPISESETPKSSRAKKEES